jgi:adenylylsulfate kinase
MKSLGTVIWFTGLSGAGKTTTAKHIQSMLIQKNRRIELLDGDELRRGICKGLTFTYEDRLENINRIIYLANLLSRNEITVIVSAITPYEIMRIAARTQLPNYVEVFVKCSIKECERRDVKGLYKKARSGELSSFTGITDHYDIPQSPDVVIDTEFTSLEDNSIKILQYLTEKSLILK